MSIDVEFVDNVVTVTNPDVVNKLNIANENLTLLKDGIQAIIDDGINTESINDKLEVQTAALTTEIKYLTGLGKAGDVTLATLKEAIDGAKATQENAINMVEMAVQEIGKDLNTLLPELTNLSQEQVQRLGEVNTNLLSLKNATDGVSDDLDKVREAQNVANSYLSQIATPKQVSTLTAIVDTSDRGMEASLPGGFFFAQARILKRLAMPTEDANGEIIPHLKVLNEDTLKETSYGVNTSWKLGEEDGVNAVHSPHLLTFPLVNGVAVDQKFALTLYYVGQPPIDNLQSNVRPLMNITSPGGPSINIQDRQATLTTDV